MGWPHLSPLFGLLVLTFGKFGGAALPRALAFAVQRRQEPDVFAEGPQRPDRNVAGEMSVLGCRGNPEHELTAAVDSRIKASVLKSHGSGRVSGGR